MIELLDQNARVFCIVSQLSQGKLLEPTSKMHVSTRVSPPPDSLHSISLLSANTACMCFDPLCLSHSGLFDQTRRPVSDNKNDHLNRLLKATGNEVVTRPQIGKFSIESFKISG